jgi:hypothetical protein
LESEQVVSGPAPGASAGKTFKMKTRKGGVREQARNLKETHIMY